MFFLAKPRFPHPVYFWRLEPLLKRVPGGFWKPLGSVGGHNLLEALGMDNFKTIYTSSDMKWFLIAFPWINQRQPVVSKRNYVKAGAGIDDVFQFPIRNGERSDFYGPPEFSIPLGCAVNGWFRLDGNSFQHDMIQVSEIIESQPRINELPFSSTEKGGFHLSRGWPLLLGYSPPLSRFFGWRFILGGCQ